MRLFQSLYEIDLQEEGEGGTLPSLAINLIINQDMDHVCLRWKTITNGAKDEHWGMICYVDPFSGDKKHMLQSPKFKIPRLAPKCVFYAGTIQDVQPNLQGVAGGLRGRGYPSSWWLPKTRWILKVGGPNGGIKQRGPGKPWPLPPPLPWQRMGAGVVGGFEDDQNVLSDEGDRAIGQ